MWALVVVDLDEGVELGLEGFDRVRGWLLRQPLFEGLVESFDLAARCRQSAGDLPRFEVEARDHPAVSYCIHKTSVCKNSPKWLRLTTAVAVRPCRRTSCRASLRLGPDSPDQAVQHG